MTRITIKSVDVRIRVNAIQRKGKNSELSYVADKSGSARMADGECKGERQVLNLEGCAALDIRASLA